MPRCIYCLQDGASATFLSREHVIPRCLGSFEPFSPTLKRNLVCDVCNSKLFNPLETNFTEDSYEGVYGQRLNLEGRGSVTIRDKQFKVDQLQGFGDTFFDQTFLFLEKRGNQITPVLRNQIKLNRRQGGYRVFLAEGLEAIRQKPRAFKKLSEDLKKLSQRDIAIFGETGEKVGAMISLLREFGISYKEKESRYHLLEPGTKLIFEGEYRVSINTDIGRVLAKIAFNYFAYCALQSNEENILYSSNFDKMRNFIHAGKGKLKDIMPSINEEPILGEEREKKMRVVAHLVNFQQENEAIVARMTFFGLPAVYKVVLGKIPPRMKVAAFGCAHIFDPFIRKIENLSHVPIHNPTNEQLKLSFGLFKRI